MSKLNNNKKLYKFWMPVSAIVIYLFLVWWRCRWCYCSGGGIVLCGGLTTVSVVHFFLGHVVMSVEEYTCVFTISAYFSTVGVLGVLGVFLDMLWCQLKNILVCLQFQLISLPWVFWGFWVCFYGVFFILFIFYLTVLVYIFPVRCVLLLQAPQLLMSEPNSGALAVFNLNK